ncbi:MAG: hypothetical protein A2W91_16310 [Bacteroidetes bacterium GWF2_38_335]|nr:MAG: hypothetical protein A2W91_16310 [Bacteroidetes bacterium GWF2_38_335]OFY81253.1 MAG: hypothetical protein A2281_07285 [Bacteroidetes bacterium RIFOXYA12_FULL_38_20]HBS85370.1 hypothetical protein [Bacteroidales bacterium]
MKLILLSLGLFVIACSNAQITITSSDMPSVDDTFRISTTINIPIDHTLTGEDYFWDFSALEYDSQDIDSFVHVNDAPFSYALIFIYPVVATIAKPAESPNVPEMAPITVAESYDFFKESSSSFVKAGFAAKINDLPTPRKYDNPELIYTFPLTYGNAPDSSLSFYDISVPTFGYYGQTIKRVNYIDGWGQIATPFGTFDCVRVRSDLYLTDTIYVESYGMGFNYPRPVSHEYKWLANGQYIPVLQISDAASPATAVYKDSVRTSIVGTNELYDDFQAKVFPNPATENINVHFRLDKQNAVSIEIIDLEGKSYGFIFQGSGHRGINKLKLDLSDKTLTKGVYFLKFTSEGKSFVKKIVLNSNE